VRYFIRRTIIVFVLLLLFMLSACKGNNVQNEGASATSTITGEIGTYPVDDEGRVTLEPSKEELIDPRVADSDMSLQNQEAYPSISGGEDITYPGANDDGLNPYPGSEVENSLSYPEPVSDLTENSPSLPPLDQATPTPTSTLASLITVEPTSTTIPEATASPVPTLVPTETSTPTPSATPTATMLPLVIDRSLKASDPKLLKLASGNVQLIEFFSFWDATSKALAPMMNQLKSEFGKSTNFYFLDIDDPATQVFKKQLGYRLQPHLFILDAKGNILNDWVGFVDESELRDELKKALHR
jgi:thiol-disulfide isomerase/thioredoxin